MLHIEFGNRTATEQDVSDELAAAHAELLNGRSSMEVFIESISTSEYTSAVLLDKGAVEGVFFAHQDLVNMAKRYPYTFLLGCTHKCNKYDMPLLSLVGITSTYESFNAGFAFLRSDDEQSYKWALRQFSRYISPEVMVTDRDLELMNAIAAVFPNTKSIICIRQINSKLQAHSKKKFDTGEEWERFLNEWNDVVASLTPEIFATNWNAFEEAYIQSHPSTIEYIKKTWLIHQESFIACFIDQHLHIGTTSIARIQGNHIKLKRCIQDFTLDLMAVFKRVNPMLRIQKAELTKSSFSGRTKIAHHHRAVPALRELLCKVSFHALDLLLVQMNINP